MIVAGARHRLARVENSCGGGMTEMPGQIIVLTGDSGSGKTTTCLRLAERVSGQGLDCAGIVCPGRFDGTRKTGIGILNLRTQERRSLAVVNDRPGPLRTRMYQFDVEVMNWGMAALESACPCDLLLIDELGPLELERGQGWVNAFDILRAGQFRLAVVVVRPSLVEAFAAVMGIARESLLTLHKTPGDDDLIARLLVSLR
jgi:nucleoside-triphosphatase